MLRKKPFQVTELTVLGFKLFQVTDYRLVEVEEREIKENNHGDIPPAIN